RIRRSHGLAPLRHHHDHHGDPGEVREQVRLLRGRSLMSAPLQQLPRPSQPGSELETVAVTVPKRSRSRWRRGLAQPKTFAGRVVLAVLLVAFALHFLYPFAWLLAASFKPRGQVFDNALIPKTFQPDNYVEVFNEPPLLAWMGNSMLIALLPAGFVTVPRSLLAFGFAYFKFPGRGLLFGIVLATMMLPGAVTLVPQFLIWNNLGFVGTSVPLWGMNLFGSAFYIFLQRQFFLGLPREIFEAARMDGV